MLTVPALGWSKMLNTAVEAPMYMLSPCQQPTLDVENAISSPRIADLEHKPRFLQSLPLIEHLKGLLSALSSNTFHSFTSAFQARAGSQESCGLESLHFDDGVWVYPTVSA
jgi:hypothetical protein